MNTNILIKFAELQMEIKRIQDATDQAIQEFKDEHDFETIKNQALEEMLAEKQKTYPSEYGNITVVERKSYEYPDFWTQETEKFKHDKKELEKKLLLNGNYSVNVSIQVSGKPKTLDTKPSVKGRIH